MTAAFVCGGKPLEKRKEEKKGDTCIDQRKHQQQQKTEPGKVRLCVCHCRGVGVGVGERGERHVQWLSGDFKSVTIKRQTDRDSALGMCDCASVCVRAGARARACVCVCVCVRARARSHVHLARTVSNV